jgi:predicted RNA-binding protein with PIN domain
LVAYLVDGNNVMAQRVGWHRDKAGARRRLLAELACFARSAGVPVAVVFDGAPDPDTPDGTDVEGVRVYFAARGSDADTRIRDLVERSPEPGALLVVTSDQRLADDVRRYGAQVMRSGELRRQLEALDASDVAERQPDTSPVDEKSSSPPQTTRRARRRPAR